MKLGRFLSAKTIPIVENAFEAGEETAIYWLGGAGVLLNIHETILMIDPVLRGFDMPLEGAVTLANAYPNADLLCIHWGTVDAPEMTPFNGEPNKLLTRVVNPERVLALLPGEKYALKKK